MTSDVYSAAIHALLGPGDVLPTPEHPALTRRAL
jgi:hypothetical protein